MPWPTDSLDKTHLDEGADNPALARPMLAAAIDALKAVIGMRGAAGGVAGLDAAGRVPDAQLGRGEARGVAELGADARVPSAQLPSASTGKAGVTRLSASVSSHTDRPPTAKAVKDAIAAVSAGSGITSVAAGTGAEIEGRTITASGSVNGSTLTINLAASGTHSHAGDDGNGDNGGSPPAWR